MMLTTDQTQDSSIDKESEMKLDIKTNKVPLYQVSFGCFEPSWSAGVKELENLTLQELKEFAVREMGLSFGDLQLRLPEEDFIWWMEGKMNQFFDYSSLYGLGPGHVFMAPNESATKKSIINPGDILKNKITGEVNAVLEAGQHLCSIDLIKTRLVEEPEERWLRFGFLSDWGVFKRSGEKKSDGDVWADFSSVYEIERA